MMSKLTAICLALGLGLVLYAHAAATYDGSVPLICALIEVMDCAPGADCQRGVARKRQSPPIHQAQLHREDAEHHGSGAKTTVHPDQEY